MKFRGLERCQKFCYCKMIIDGAFHSKSMDFLWRENSDFQRLFYHIFFSDLTFFIHCFLLEFKFSCQKLSKFNNFQFLLILLLIKLKNFYRENSNYLRNFWRENSNYLRNFWSFKILKNHGFFAQKFKSIILNFDWKLNFRTQFVIIMGKLCLTWTLRSCNSSRSNLTTLPTSPSWTSS